jgi:hypothetical protein
MAKDDSSFWEQIGCAAMIVAVGLAIAIILAAGRMHLVH